LAKIWTKVKWHVFMAHGVDCILMTMQVVVNALIQAIPAIFNVLLVCLVFLQCFCLCHCRGLCPRSSSCVSVWAGCLGCVIRGVSVTLCGGTTCLSRLLADIQHHGSQSVRRSIRQLCRPKRKTGQRDTSAERDRLSRYDLSQLHLDQTKDQLRQRLHRLPGSLSSGNYAVLLQL